MLEGAQIIFRNFTGVGGSHNREGVRNFAMILPDDLAQEMLDKGWNVKRIKPKADDPEPPFYISIEVGFKHNPPRIVLVTSKGRTALDEGLCEILDQIDVNFCDVIISPYDWKKDGKSGRKAYLKTIYVMVQEDFLDKKYEDLPELGSDGKVLELESGDGTMLSLTTGGELPMDLSDMPYIDGEVVSEIDYGMMRELEA